MTPAEIAEDAIWGGRNEDDVRRNIEDAIAEATALQPWESMALTVAVAQMGRGETSNVVTACLLALARLTGRELPS